MTIVNRLFEIRTRRELTQQEVADLTGVSRVTVGRLDRDRRYRPKGKTMQELARGLGLRIGDLFDDDELPEPGHPVVGPPSPPADRLAGSDGAAHPLHPAPEPGANDLVAAGVTRVVVGKGNGTALQG
jgi:DNA-binding XRE family transcriptional regulator